MGYFDNIDFDLVRQGLRAQQKPEKTEKTGLLRKAADIGVAGAQGVVGGVKMLSDVFGADNAVSGVLGSANEGLGSLYSGGRMQEMQERQRLIKEAEENGTTLDQIKANLGGFFEAPVSTIAQGVGSIAPSIAAALIPGGQGVAGANLVRTAAMLGLGAGQGAGAVKGSIYEGVKRELLQAGASPEEAEARATDAQAYSGPNAGQIGLGAGVGAVAGRLGVEGAVERIAKGVGTSPKALLPRVGGGVVTEGGTEAFQGGQERYAVNQALNNEGFEVDPFKGVAGNAALEGVVGGVIGGGLNLPAPKQVEVSSGDLIRRNLQPETGALAKAVNAGIESQAQAADAGFLPPSEPEQPSPEPLVDPVENMIRGLPEGDKQIALQAYAVVNRDDVAKGVKSYNKKLLDGLLKKYEIQPEAATPSAAAPAQAPAEPAAPVDLEAKRQAAVSAARAELGESVATVAPTAELPVEIPPNQPLGIGNPAEVATNTVAPNINPATDEIRSPVAAREDDRAQPQSNFATYEDASQFISEQRRRGTRVQALPLPLPDGSFGYAMKGTPEFAVAEFAKKERALRAAGVLDGDVLNNAGDPFPAKIGAQRAASRTPGKVVQVEGGWVVRPQGAADVSPAAPVGAVDSGVARPANPEPAGGDGVGASLATDRADGVLPVTGTPAPSSEPGVAVGTALAGNSLTNGEVDGPQADQAQQTEAERAEAPAAVEPLASITRAGGLPFKSRMALTRRMKQPDSLQPFAAASDETVANESDGARLRSSDAPNDAIAGEPIDSEWTAFSDASGTLRIPRAEMPQVRADRRGAMVNFLNARGIKHEQTEVPAADLKPTQAEFSPAKVAKARANDKGDRSILISSDGHVLDGHHQWMARREAGESVKAIRLDAPITRLLDEIKEFPSVQSAPGAGEPAGAAPAEASSETAENSTNPLLAQAKSGVEAIENVAPKVQTKQDEAGNTVLFSRERRDLTDSDAFKRWFGDSKVVDSEGKPLVVYHGSEEKGIAVFESEDDRIYFTDSKAVANGYGRKIGARKNEQTYAVFLKMERPDVYDMKGASWYSDGVGTEVLGYIRAAQDEGFDGVVLENFVDGATERAAKPSTVYVVFKPEQVKSATENNGNFDPANLDIRLSRNELGQFAGKADNIRQIVETVSARWKNPPGIVVINSMADAPSDVTAEYERQNSQGADGEAEGFYHRGKVYLVASALNTPADVTRVLFHETLGHAGLRGNFDGVLEPILDQIATLRGDLLRPVAEKYGFNLSDRGDRLKAAEEVLAFLAQTKPEIGYVKRAIAAIRTWLRANIPGFAAMKLSDAEIVNNFILPARQFVERGTQKPERTPELQPAFGRREQLAVQLAPAIVGGNLGSASALPMYEAAKAGDVVAAVEVAKALVTPDLTEKVRRAIGTERPVVVPVASVEAAGRNKIPLAAAKVLAKELGLKTADGLVQSNSPKRTALNGLDRIFAQPEFDGQVEPGQSYVLVDDTLTQGATFAALASHIQQNGGRVLASVALTGKTYSATLTPNPETLKRLREKYADLEPQFQAATGFGFDGLTQSEARYLANFEPSQSVRDRIVEAGNQAGYGQNPADSGPVNEPGLPPVFSRTADSAGAQSVAATKTDPKAVLNEALTRTGGALANRLDLALNLLTRRQIVDVYEKDIPELKNYSTLVQRMDADKNEVGAQADQLADRWGKLRDEKPLAELMHDATLARTDPDLPFAERQGEKPLERRSRLVEHKALTDRFNALSDGAKAVYRETRDAYRVQYDNIKEAIRENIERAIKDEPTRLKFLDRLDTEFFKDIQGVYFPLARFGDYLVNVRDAEGTIIAHHRAETLNEANHLRAQLMAQGKTLGWDVGKVLKSKEFNARRDLAGKGFIKEIMDTLKTSGVDGNVIDSVAQLYLQSLPDLSWAKHGIHRKGTPGFSQDARRAFASNMFFGARYLAKLRYNDKLLASLATMQEQVDSGAYNEAYDSVAAQKVVDHMNKRHDSLMNPDTNPVSTALTSIGFIFHLGLSPASAMVNLSQTALVAYPIMGAKWGFAKASAALLSASKLVTVSKNDLSNALTGDEKAAYEQAVKDGTIDVTQAHDLAGIAQGEDSKVAWKIRPVMKWASFLFHHAERFNRQVTFLAAYRLAREVGTVHDQAVEQATKATIDGHFDYSASNRAMAMQGNFQRVVFLFKQYAQNMVYTMSRQAFIAMKGQTPAERAEARKALGGLLTMHAAAAGGLGLPMVSTLLAAASFLGGDDDEPWNAEVALKNTLADTFGPKAAEVMAHGLSRLTPWDISGRVGLDKLLFPDIQEGLDGGRWFESAATAALGPVVGIGLNALKGLQDVSEGRTVRGLEGMMPTALRGPLKAYRYATEGNVDRTGVVINDEVSLSGIAGQAAGFSPSETRAAQEVRSAIYSHDNALVERRKSLMNQYAAAKMAGDDEGAQEVREMINGFNEKNPARRIKPMQLVQSVRRRQQRIDSAEEGVYLPKNRRDAISAVRFGELAEDQ